MKDAQPVSAPAQLGEGPLWDARRSRLMWTDVTGRRLHSFDPATSEDSSVICTQETTTLALVADRPEYLVTSGRDLCLQQWPSPRRATVATLDKGFRANDGTVDVAGRLVIGTMVDEGQRGEAALYQLRGRQVRELLTGVTISNGIDWSLDGNTMYYIDTTLERVDAFDYDLDSGALSNRRIFIDLADVPGRPDGLCVDAEGGIWVAMARGGASVLRLTPTARVDEIIKLPVPHVTSVAFGGQMLEDLYITTSQLEMTREGLQQYPSAGCLFRIDNVGIQGRPAHSLDLDGAMG